MNKLITGALATLFSLFLIAPFTTAETITLPIGEQTKQSAMELPVRSMNKQDVLRDFGDPQEITDAVGEPPISQWVYEEYGISTCVCVVVRDYVCCSCVCVWLCGCICAYACACVWLCACVHLYVSF